MKKSQRKSFVGSARCIFLVAIAALLLVVGIIVYQTRPVRVIGKKQDALIAGIEKRNAARMKRMVAESYEDKWGFDDDEAIEAIVDVGSQFMALVLTAENREIEIEGERATVKVDLTVSGKPVGPVGNEVTRRLNRLTNPFVFEWEKQSFLPSSWRLVRIDHEDLPAELYGYEPGDIRRAMKGE